MSQWNLWHGCHKISPGCENCYVYRSDARYDRDASIVRKTQSFDLPLKRNRKGEYKIEPNSLLYTCFSSDFFVEDADEWRPEAWAMMRERSDVLFMFLTKRIHRFYDCIPPDWGDGYDNVYITCTVENQRMADYRLPIFKGAPIKHKGIASEPLLGPIDMAQYLGRDIKSVIVGGESGPGARVCDYDWVLDIRRQCVEADVPFVFKQTGRLLRKDGRIYEIERKLQHSQAAKAGINTQAWPVR